MMGDLVKVPGAPKYDESRSVGKGIRAALAPAAAAVGSLLVGALLKYFEANPEAIGSVVVGFFEDKALGMLVAAVLSAFAVYLRDKRKHSATKVS